MLLAVRLPLEAAGGVLACGWRQVRVRAMFGHEVAGRSGRAARAFGRPRGHLPRAHPAIA